MLITILTIVNFGFYRVSLQVIYYDVHKHYELQMTNGKYFNPEANI